MNNSYQMLTDYDNIETADIIGTDNSTMSRLLQTGKTMAGNIVTALLFPFCCCGAGTLKVVPEGKCAVVLKFGKFNKIVGPGTYYYNIGRDKFIIVSMQIN